MRRISSLRGWHQIPFLKARPDRRVFPGIGAAIGDGSIVGLTGWPGMAMILPASGWLGFAPSDRSITMRSLDFWRCEERPFARQPGRMLEDFV